MRTLHIRVLSYAHPLAVTAINLTQPPSRTPALPAPQPKAIHPHPVANGDPFKVEPAPPLPPPIHKVVFQTLLNNHLVLVASLQHLRPNSVFIALCYLLSL
jgi:hypothetical protein